jgi:hypothetical protein
MAKGKDKQKSSEKKKPLKMGVADHCRPAQREPCEIVQPLKSVLSSLEREPMSARVVCWRGFCAPFPFCECSHSLNEG